MGTHGVGTFLINSKFASGSLIFYEKAVGRTATGDVLTIGTTAVTVGGTAQDVDLAFYGTGSISAIIDCGDSSFTLVGINMTSNAAVTLTASATLQVGESSTGVTTAGGTTMIYGYGSHGTNALTGDLIGVRGNARVNIDSASGSAIGGYFQAGNMSAGYNLSNARGIYIDVVTKEPAGVSATWTNARGVEVSMDLDQGASGHTFTVTNAYMFYGVYNLPTSGTYATVTNGYGVYLVNEAVGGTGQQIDAAFYAKGLNQSGGIVAWDYGMQLYNCVRPFYAESTYSGSTAKNLMSLTVTDTTTCSTGYGRGLYIDWNSTGAKTGDGEINAIGIDIDLQANVTYAYGLSLYFSQTGNPTAYCSAISVYMDNMGTAATNLMCADFQLAQTSSISGGSRFGFIRCRDQGTNKPDAVIMCEGANAADALFTTDANAGNGFVVAGGAGTCTITGGWVKFTVVVNGVTYYIPAGVTLNNS